MVLTSPPSHSLSIYRNEMQGLNRMYYMGLGFGLI